MHYTTLFFPVWEQYILNHLYLNCKATKIKTAITLVSYARLLSSKLLTDSITREALNLCYTCQTSCKSPENWSTIIPQMHAGFFAFTFFTECLWFHVFNERDIDDEVQRSLTKFQIHLLERAQLKLVQELLIITVYRLTGSDVIFLEQINTVTS